MVGLASDLHVIRITIALSLFTGRTIRLTLSHSMWGACFSALLSLFLSFLDNLRNLTVSCQTSSASSSSRLWVTFSVPPRISCHQHWARYDKVQTLRQGWLLCIIQGMSRKSIIVLFLTELWGWILGLMYMLEFAVLYGFVVQGDGRYISPLLPIGLDLTLPPLILLLYICFHLQVQFTSPWRWRLSSETLVLYHITMWCHNPEHHNSNICVNFLLLILSVVM